MAPCLRFILCFVAPFTCHGFQIFGRASQSALQTTTLDPILRGRVARCAPLYDGRRDDRFDVANATATTAKRKTVNDVVQKEDIVDRILSLYPPRLLVADLLALLVASELMGLLNVLGDEAFVRSGGWLQPVTTILPPSLSLQLEHWSINAVVYVTSAVCVATLDSSPQPVVRRALYTSGGFFLLRCLLEWLVLPDMFVATALNVPQWGGDPGLAQRLELVREWYIVTLTTVTSRYLYSMSSYDS